MSDTALPGTRPVEVTVGEVTVRGESVGQGPPVLLLRLRCPVLALWSATGAVGAWYEPLEVWREWADDVRGRAVDCGHFLPEEAPDEVADELLAFLAAVR